MINYLKLNEWVRSKKALCTAVKYLNKILTAVIYISYPLFLVVIFYLKEPMLSSYIAFPAVAFIEVSILRYCYNSPRPYQKFDYMPIGKDFPKRGNSFPSRHTFSAFMVSLMFLHYCLPLGVIYLVLSTLLAIVRVLSGMHFVKDVVAGFIIAILVYIIMLLII